MVLRFVLIICVGLLSLAFENLSLAKNKNNFPSQTDYPEYEIIDARDTTNLSVNTLKDHKLAIVVRNLVSHSLHKS